MKNFLLSTTSAFIHQLPLWCPLHGLAMEYPQSLCVKGLVTDLCTTGR
jgi:hypothetical protein